MPLTHALGFPFFTKFEPALKISCVLQFLILLFSALLLDGGQVNQFIVLCAVPYWCGVAIIMVCRNGDATLVDRFLMKWGYPLAMPLTAAVSAIVPMGLLRSHPSL